MVHAVGFGQLAATIEWINEDLPGARLVTAEEMPGQSDADDRQAQTARDQDIEETEINGIARAPVEHAVEVAVLRIVILAFVALESQFGEEIIAHRAGYLAGSLAGRQPLAQFPGETVQQGLIRLHVDVGIKRARQ